MYITSNLEIMKIAPLFKVRGMRKALAHYTEVLDFTLVHPNESAQSWVVDLVNGDALLQLTVLEGDYLFGSVANVWVDDVDALFFRYKTRGLDTSGKEHSPVHLGPTDQSWGTREFYVTDADRNTLRFCQAR